MKIYFYICIYAYIYHKPKDKCSPLRSNRRMVKQSLLLIVDCAVGILFFYLFLHSYKPWFVFCFAVSAQLNILLWQCSVSGYETFRIAKKNVHDSNSLAVLFVNIFVSSTLFRLSLQLCWMLEIFLII